MSERDEKDSGFKVVDKRRFTATGDLRADAPAGDDRAQARAALETKVAAAAATDPRRTPPAAAAETKATSAPKPSESSIDFIGFAASLATNALAALGALPEARARGIPVNPDLAREYIDILVMLEEKTHGNLSREEAATLRRLVSDLQLNYVEIKKRAAAAAPAKRS